MTDKPSPPKPSEPAKPAAETPDSPAAKAPESIKFSRGERNKPRPTGDQQQK